MAAHYAAQHAKASYLWTQREEEPYCILSIHSRNFQFTSTVHSDVQENGGAGLSWAGLWMLPSVMYLSSYIGHVEMLQMYL